MTKLTAKSSTIFIATADRTEIYRSLEEVPPALRRKLQESTRGANSATILIADKGGRAELVRALQGRSTTVQCRIAQNVREQKAADESAKPAQERARFTLRTWIELLLPLIIGASLWLLIGSRF